MPFQQPPIRGLLIDLDGVIYTGNDPIAGASQFLSRAKERGLPFLLVTNNSTRRGAEVAARLTRMGIRVTADEILTSGEAAAAMLAARDSAARVLVVGEPGLVESVARAGLCPSPLDADPGSIQWVLAGLDRSFDYAKLTAATQAILAGARFMATNADALLPVEGGRFLPGAGSLVGAIRAATGVEPLVVGKPEAALFRRGVELLGLADPASALMVGDRIDTDIDGARRAGVRTALVLTGVTTGEEAARLDPAPDYVVPRLADLAPMLGL